MNEEGSCGPLDAFVRLHTLHYFLFRQMRTFLICKGSAIQLSKEIRMRAHEVFEKDEVTAMVPLKDITNR